MNRFEFHQPKSLEETIDLLIKYGDKASLLAGGTALLIDIKRGECCPERLISLWGISRLGYLTINGDSQSPGGNASTMRIGSLVTITDLAQAAKNNLLFKSLVEAAWMLGSLQVQNIATVGGNICKASPGADMVPPLLCLDARLHLIGPAGERMTPLDGFLTGPDQTAIHPAEVLTEISVPSIAPRSGTAFLKVMRRRAVDCSIVAVAARVTLSEDARTCLEARLALGAVAPNPFRARDAENVLIGKVIEPDLIREAAQQARNESRPVSDVRASADYRRFLVETLVERAILISTQRALGEAQ